ncbi:MAG: DUF1638 domain-containing protein, partial [Spirochaetaceae bacterium]|nr:DUF1638 domain-containing protein [Spirochaetaceae bacterium]
MTREISLIAASCENTLHLHFMEQELHNRPDELRNALQAEIDLIEAAFGGAGAAAKSAAPGKDDADAIVLAYGLCSNAICGLRSRRYPVVVPRAHDCMTLIVGSRERYQEYFDRHPGTYWYTPGWIEQTP